jgi:hypothetical protein
MSEYYPGSKQSLIDYDAAVGDDELETALGEPYKYLRYHGVRTAFYSIGSLARALNRSPVTIRKWEADGTIPKTNLHPPKGDKALGGKVRLYTREQIAGLRDIAESCGILRETWRPIKDTNFRELARELFEEG